MKIPFSWLKVHVATEQAPHEIADTLVRLGHEVEGVEMPREAVRGVRVGLIESMRPHPNADRLSLLKVNIGEDAPLDIVCGASNMQPGDKVPVATIGTSLPNGMKIKKGKIRGETSHGMCCSGVELGLSEEADGLLILPADTPVGAEVGEYLGLEEAVFDLSITPNRGDCMNVRGLAREIAADADLPLAPVDVAAVAGDTAVAAPVVSVSASEDCPVYMARRIEGIRVGPSPDWMQSRLRAAGQRPVNGIVDVLNYIMLDIGQPMHAFDADRLQGGITVRAAAAGEAFHALDGRTLALHAGDLVVCDDKEVIALAGIMGSEPSGVSDATVNIVLESAFFRPARVSETRRIYAMVSEASMRFERGVDPAMVGLAMQRATAMITELFGGTAGAMAVCGDAAGINAGRTLDCEVSRLAARLGVDIPASADAVLARMGFGIERKDGTISVRVPTFRHDVSIAEDMSEEYARVIGFDAIPAELPPLPGRIPARGDTAIADAVAGGFVQVISYAFVSPEQQRMFMPDDGCDIRLENPISEDMAVMRRSLWPGLLGVARHNLNRQQPGAVLVEQGRVYVRDNGGHSERDVIGWLMTGEIERDEWYAEARQADFFDLKGALEAWLAARGLQARFVADDGVRGLQAGQSAKVLVGRTVVGVIGRVDASIAAHFDIETGVFVAEVTLEALPAGRRPKFEPLPEFPGVERDLVFLFDRGTSAADIVQTAAKAGGRLLTEARIFDRYVGKGVPEGKVSLGVRFTLQAKERTLTQEDSDAASEAIVAAMREKFGAELRGG